MKLKKPPEASLDKVQTTFNKWAKIGRSELLEKEHAKTVLRFLESVSFEKPFSFLDVGCGNGWVVRRIAQFPNCKRACGLDISKNMIKNANSKKKSSKENYFHGDIKSWKYSGKFEYIFSMESLYYSIPMEPSLKKVYKLLHRGGKFLCGTDFFKDNKATSGWSRQMGVPMDLRSRAQWKKMFEEAGFDTKTRLVKDPKNRKKWKQQFGTLFVIGTKMS